MLIPLNVLATADDLGFNISVNRAILHCFENGYINSTSFITNTLYFDETVCLIHENPSVVNVGLHINLADGKPVTNFVKRQYLNESGNWNIEKIDKKFNLLDTGTKQAFAEEIAAQIEKALAAKVTISHLDSHYHLHTLPCFYQLFLEAAKKYKLKLRLAQSYHEGNYLKFLYRKRINNLFQQNKVNYSDYFETVNRFLNRHEKPAANETVEIMLHPDFDASGKLTDHYDAETMAQWLQFLGGAR